MATKRRTGAGLKADKFFECVLPPKTTRYRKHKYAHGKGGLDGAPYQPGDGGALDYVNRMRALIRMTAAETQWELDNESTFYLAVTVNVGGTALLNQPTNYTRETIKKIKTGQELPIRRPTLTKIAEYISKALEGIVIGRQQQIVAVLIARRYNFEHENVEFILGAVKTWGQLNYDIRNV